MDGKKCTGRDSGGASEVELLSGKLQEMQVQGSAVSAVGDNLTKGKTHPKSERTEKGEDPWVHSV